jgi:hypothetical protein
MPGKEEFGFRHEGIGNVLAHSRVAVPLNQREYSWEKEHIIDLFSDLANAIASHRSTYFLGTIVLTRGASDVPEVSDGQQRLATTSILLASIRDYFKAARDYKRKESIEQEFLKTTDLETTETVPKLSLNVDDNEFFRKYIVDGDKTAEPSKESHKRIELAAKLATEHIHTIIDPFKRDDLKVQRLLEWVKFLREGAEVIVLQVPDHLNAFVMFETLNDRGLKASQADLIKNHLLSLCGLPKMKQGQQKWAEMLGILESLGQDEITISYLHHLLILKTGPTTAREIFDKVRNLVNSQSRSLEFLEELADSANDYAALFNPEHRKWNEYGTSTRKHLITIQRDLRVEQIRPLLFAIARHFSVKEAKEAIRLAVFWSVRFLMAGGRGGLLDRNYAQRAEEIASGKIKTASALKTALADILPSDALFETAMAEARISQIFVARYLLRALEMKAKKDPEPENIPNEEENVINLEHILPEHPGGNWSHVDSDTAAVMYKRLGNMVLLQAKKNALIGNSSFSDKRKHLKDSAFVLTSDVAKCSQWGAKEIKERQSKLAQLAVETWPLS